MKNILFVVIILLLTINSFAQIHTEMFEKGKAFEKHPKFKLINQNSVIKKIPAIDISPLIAADKANKNSDIPFRFGKSIDLNYTLNDGKWLKLDSTKVWSLKIISPNAYSLNFIFSELYLPKGSELYIYNEDGTMVYGPVTEIENQSSKNFLTDIIQGESATIQLTVPISSNEEPALTIQKLIHGYKDLFSTTKSGYGESGNCTQDVACYPSWNEESDGIVQILLSSGDEICSGSLLNNTVQDYKPYVLTAFHCIDIGDLNFHTIYEQNGILEDFEIERTHNWLVRFRFRHTTCGGSTFANVLTYNGTNFRSAWVQTDFALVELQVNIIDDSYSVGQKVWLGWDHSGNTPTNGTSIHHPSGDVAKISFENNSLVVTNYNGINDTPHWKVTKWDNGVTEKGSSGAPLFDQNKKVIGQLHGGSSSCSNPDGSDYFGGFYRSWTGGGTNTTRLSNWLQPTGTGNTLNSKRQPMPEYSGGTNSLCIGATSSYTVTNFASNYSVNHWNGSNVTFPNGNTSNPVVVQGSTTGAGWVEAVINVGWGTFTMERKYITVGAPTPYIIGAPTVKCGYNHTYTVDQTSEIGGESFYWESDILGLVDPYAKHCIAYGVMDGGGYISCTVTSCGVSKTSTKNVNAIACETLLVSPNPSTNETTISIESNSNDSFDASTPWDLEVYDQKQLIKVKKSGLKEKTIKLETSQWKDGVYIVRAIIGDRILSGKLIVKQ